MLEERGGQVTVGNVLVVSAGAHRGEGRAAGIVVDREQQVDVAVQEDLLALGHRQVDVSDTAQDDFGAFLHQEFPDLVDDTQVDIALLDAGRAHGTGKLSTVAGVQSDGEAFEGEVFRRMLDFDDQGVAVVVDAVAPAVFLLELDDEPEHVAVDLLEVDVFDHAQFIVLGDPVAVVHRPEDIHVDGGRIERGPGCIGEPFRKGESDAVDTAGIGYADIVRIDGVAAARAQFHVFLVDVGKTVGRELNLVEVVDGTDYLEHDARVEEAHLRTAEAVAARTVLEIGHLLGLHIEQAVFHLRLRSGSRGWVPTGVVEEVELLRLDVRAFDQRDLDGIVTGLECQLFTECAGLVDLDLFTVDGGQDAGVGDADQIVPAVGDGVSAGGRGPAESDVRRSVCRGAKQEGCN